MKKKCMRCLRHILALWLHYSAAVMLLVLLCLYALAYTAPGLKLLLYVSEHLGSHVFKAERLIGHQIGHFSLTKVRYKCPSFSLSAGSVVVRWHPIATLLHLKRHNLITLSHVRLMVPHIIDWRGSIRIEGRFNDVWVRMQSTHEKSPALSSVQAAQRVDHSGYDQHTDLHITRSREKVFHFTLNWKYAEAYIRSSGWYQRRDHWRVRWRVHVPQLHAVLPHIQGTLLSHGSVSVHPQTLCSRFSLQGQHLRLHVPQASWLPVAIQDLKSQGTLQWRPGQHSKIIMNIKGLQFYHHYLDTLSLRVNGWTTRHHGFKHRLTLTMTPFHEQAMSQKPDQLVLSGQLTRSPWVWRATMRTLTLGTQTHLPWLLTHPARLSLSHKQFFLEPLCWKNKRFPTTCLRTRVYTQGRFSHTHLHLDRFPLTLLNTLLPPETYLKIIQGHTGVDVDRRIALYTTQGHPMWTIRVRASHIKVQLLPLNLTVHVFPLTLRVDDRKLRYRAQLQSGQGRLTVQGHLLFDPYKRHIRGQTVLNGAEILMSNTPSYYIVGNPHLVLDIQDQQLNLSGKIWVTQAKIHPHHFDAVVTLPHELTFSDHLDSSTEHKGYAFNQNLLIKLGRHVSLRMMGLKGLLRGQLNIQKLPQQITQASGQLSIRQGVYQAYGQDLSIEQGQLNFTGGSLSDPSIKILSSKTITLSPTNPFHTLNTLTVGIQLNGSLKHLRPHFFSRPAGLSDVDILSYLILGEPHSHHTQSSLLQALGHLSFHQGAPGGFNLKSHLQKRLGLHELDIKTKNSHSRSADGIDLTQFTQLSSLKEDLSPEDQAGSDNNTSVVVGKYLSPKLYLHYNFNMNGNDQLFDISYSLGHHWTLQSQTSTSGNNSVDLLYHIWKD